MENTINLAHESKIDRLFRKADGPFGSIRCNPVTGSKWVGGADPIAPQKRAACRALIAREWFRLTAPKDAPRLPLSYGECEALKSGGLTHIVAWFAQSLEACDYDFTRHPSFEDYARGVLASPLAPDFIKQDQRLLQRFPPRQLHGLGSGLVWR